MARKHTATKSSVANTLQLQLSGYGANGSTINRTLDEMGVRDPVDLSDWGEDQVHSLVDAFLKVCLYGHGGPFHARLHNAHVHWTSHVHARADGWCL